MKKPPPLREKIRQYLFETNLSSEARIAFNRTFENTVGSTSVQKAFAAAKKAVEDLPKEKRFRTTDSEDSVDNADADAELIV